LEEAQVITAATCLDIRVKSQHLHSYTDPVQRLAARLNTERKCTKLGVYFLCTVIFNYFLLKSYLTNTFTSKFGMKI